MQKAEAQNRNAMHNRTQSGNAQKTETTQQKHKCSNGADCKNVQSYWKLIKSSGLSIFRYMKLSNPTGACMYVYMYKIKNNLTHTNNKEHAI
jgi:hypothetical protein